MATSYPPSETIETEPPPGFRFEWVDDEHGWTTDPEYVDGKVCRRMLDGHRICRRPAVAALNRGRYTPSGKAASWWAYCELHLYGRRIENGVVQHRRWVPDA